MFSSLNMSNDKFSVTTILYYNHIYIYDKLKWEHLIVL